MWFQSKKPKRNTKKQSMIVSYFSHHRLAAGQGLQQIFHQSLLNSMVILAIGIAMAMPTMLFMSFHYLQHYNNHWHDSAQAAVYLKSSQNQQAIDKLVLAITHDPTIKSARYVSPEQGLNDFKKETQLGQAAELLEDNPLPGVILLKPFLNQPQEHFNTLLASLYNNELVDEVDLDVNWFNRLLSLLNLGSHTVVLLAVLLGGSMLLIICNMVYLVLQRYSHDIDIYLTLGASKRFVRRPYLYMGLYYGTLAYCTCWMIIAICGVWLQPALSRFTGSYGEPLVLGMPSQNLLVITAILALSLGLFGARLAAWQFLKQHR